MAVAVAENKTKEAGKYEIVAIKVLVATDNN